MARVWVTGPTVEGANIRALNHFRVSTLLEAKFHEVISADRTGCTNLDIARTKYTYAFPKASERDAKG